MTLAQIDSYPNPQPNAQRTVLVYDWSEFGLGQKQWPIPVPSMLIAFFVFGMVAPILGGRIGITAAFLLAACLPSKRLRVYLAKGDLISLFCVVTCAMTLGNLDALGDLLGSVDFRFSWVLLGMSALVVPLRLKLLRGRVAACCIVMGVLIAFHLLSTIGKTSFLRAVEMNGSYMAIFLLSSITLVRRDTRDAMVWQLALICMVNCGFCFYEIIFPGSDITISSSRLGEQTLRSAGIYANAITSGLMVSNFLLLTAMSCTKANPSWKEKLSLAVYTGFAGIGVLVTFSRSAALAFFLAGIMAAFRLSNNRFGTLAQYAPFALILLIVSFFGTGEYLMSTGSLHNDASSRYTMVKETMTGDFGQIIEALEHRAGAWQPSRKYWRQPKPLGQGFNFIAEHRIFPPHNMVILTLVETGWVGLILLIGVILVLCGFGTWPMTGRNVAVFSAIFLPVLLIMIESHSLFSRRYFAIYLVMLAFTTGVLFKPREVVR